MSCLLSYLRPNACEDDGWSFRASSIRSLYLRLRRSTLARAKIVFRNAKPGSSGAKTAPVRAKWTLSRAKALLVCPKWALAYDKASFARRDGL